MAERRVDVLARNASVTRRARTLGLAPARPP